MRKTWTKALTICGTALALGLAACGPSQSAFPEQVGGSDQHDPLGDRADSGRGYLFGGGEDGFKIFGGGSSDESQDQDADTLDRAEAEAAEQAAARKAAESRAQSDAARADARLALVQSDAARADAFAAQARVEEQRAQYAEARKAETRKANTRRDNDVDRIGIAVNEYLWRASLDTLSFMPLQSADPYGGLIITDWYSEPSTPGERFKVQVYILDKTLRADGLRVTVFRQQQQVGTGWTDSAVTSETRIKLENAILTRARQLRITDMDN